MENKKIGLYLLNKRKEKGITQKELADVLGVTYQAVSRWENGDSIPDIQILVMLADYYEVTIDDIIQRKVKIVNDETEERDTSDDKTLEIMITVVFYFGNILGLLIYGLIRHYTNGFTTHEIWPVVAYVCLFMFIFGGHFAYNIVYLTEMMGIKKSLRRYLINYGIFYVLIVFTLFVLISSPYIFLIPILFLANYFIVRPKLM